MLTLYDASSGCGRRDFLRIGSLGLGGLTLPGLLAARAEAQVGRLMKDRSVIFLFLHGGPPQAETFDPRMDRPSPHCSATGEVQTNVPGTTFGGTFEQLARHADQVSVVRSFTTEEGTHGPEPLVGKAGLQTNWGSLYTRIAGTNHPANGMPRNVALFPRLLGEDLDRGFESLLATGVLPKSYSPFAPGGGGKGAELQKSMTLGMPRARLDDRRSLLHALDRVRRSIDSTGAMAAFDRFEQQAYDVITGSVADAWDLSREDPRVVARYDTSAYADRESTKIMNYKSRYVDHALSLGKLLLLARRLCEAGCGFVTVSTTFAWDLHGDENNAGMTAGMRYSGRPLDHALSAFLEDVESRGLSDKILLVACGEMGRTPFFQRNGGGGRDHWGRLAALLLAGGGLKMGRTIGKSDRMVGAPEGDPVTPRHLLATVMHSLLDLGELRVAQKIPREIVAAVTEHEPIAGLV